MQTAQHFIKNNEEWPAQALLIVHTPIIKYNILDTLFNILYLMIHIIELIGDGHVKPLQKIS